VDLVRDRLFWRVLIAGGIAAFIVQLVVSYRKREQLRDVTGDPWNGRTLEWSTSSPPPQYNFAFTPVIQDQDAWWNMKQHGYQRPTSGFIPIHMPRNTAAGMALAFLATTFGFGLIWHIWWMAIGSFVLLIAGVIYHTFNFDRDYYVPAEEVAEVEEERTRQLASVRA
jgi:cytochrome o ubiquinol oxidase subunit 1